MEHFQEIKNSCSVIYHITPGKIAYYLFTRKIIGNKVYVVKLAMNICNTCGYLHYLCLQ